VNGKRKRRSEERNKSIDEKYANERNYANQEAKKIEKNSNEAISDTTLEGEGWES